jgi:hypothetical protein
MAHLTDVLSSRTVTCEMNSTIENSLIAGTADVRSSWVGFHSAGAVLANSVAIYGTGCSICASLRSAYSIQAGAGLTHVIVVCTTVVARVSDLSDICAVCSKQMTCGIAQAADVVSPRVRTPAASAILTVPALVIGTRLPIFEFLGDADSARANAAVARHSSLAWLTDALLDSGANTIHA